VECLGSYVSRDGQHQICNFFALQLDRVLLSESRMTIIIYDMIIVLSNVSSFYVTCMLAFVFSPLSISNTFPVAGPV